MAIAAGPEQTASLERHSEETKRKNTDKKALRRAESNASVRLRNPLAIFRGPIYIREQLFYQRGRRHAKELTGLRNKRRWVQGQLENDNIDGSTARELLKLYDKTFVYKLQEQRPRIEDMSGSAKLVNQRFEYTIEH
ncbi:MAG: hypothetical protein ALECFALPRED_007743 [Alectoria fallacina]|uniref:Uncharacterized protein n=1 Tax=Alectoria fallacina TaxID=1903189 RepID=A0A8H3J0U2_9LECA|nr:MAG: hypothetical protein ALECFALPRED_007743 [Alectoria fallacina]